MQHIRNSRASKAALYPPDLLSVFSPERSLTAHEELRQWPGFAPTPLVALPELARKLGLASLHYKDEGSRFGLGSFKGLGGAYAVFRLLSEQLSQRRGEAVDLAELRSGRLRDEAADITVVCATDGNHGRAVAFGARAFGCQCVIYIHASVSEGRREALERLGARVERRAGNYDDSVRQAAIDARENGWFVVSDTSYGDYVDVPRDVMTGYTVIAREVVDQCGGDVPTHVLTPGGVGGVAAAVCATFWLAWGACRPRFVTVEPLRAACLLESARAGAMSAVEVVEDSIMAGLSCGEPSILAWSVLDPGCSDFVAIADDWIPAAMRALAEPAGEDPPVVGGESGVAGLAVLLGTRDDDAMREALGLDESSRIVLIGTEGATDPDIYRQIVGRDGDAVVPGWCDPAVVSGATAA